MDYRIILILFGLLIPGHALGQIKPHPTLPVDTVMDFVDLGEPENSYSGFTYGDPYLVWKGYPSRTLYLYNVENKRMKYVKQSVGRGPLEVNWIIDLEFHNGYVYQFDLNNLKYLKLNTDTFQMEEKRYDFNAGSIQPVIYNTISSGEHIIAADLSNPGNFIFKIDFDQNNVIPFSMGQKNVQKIFPNPFYKENLMGIDGDKLIVVMQRIPRIYIFSLKTNELIKQTEIGEIGQVEERITSLDGQPVAIPPKANSYQKDIVAIPGSPNRILLLKKGEENGQPFHQSYTYEYDYMNGELKGAYALGFIPEKMIWIDKDLYFYTEKDGLRLLKIDNFKQYLSR